MKIAITDACIFIDLHDLNLTVSFFSIDLELYTSLDVLNELYPEQRNVLDAFVSVGKLTIHTIASAERIEIMNTNYPRALSEVDKTVLFLAKKHEAIVLSSDKVIRNHAKKEAIEYHGMLWIFDQLIEHGILSKKEAAGKLKELIQKNVMYQNNSKLMKEFEGRLMDWEG